MRSRSLVAGIVLVGAVAALTAAVTTAGAAATGGEAVAATDNEVAAATDSEVVAASRALDETPGAVAANATAEPTVDVSIDSTPVGADDTYESGSDVDLRIEASVGEGAGPGTNLTEIVVRIDDEHFRSVPLDDAAVVRTIETDLDNGDNDVRVIVTDDENNVDATEFTVVKDAEPPHLFLEEPYETDPWRDITGGNVTGTTVTLEGRVIEDSGVESMTVWRDYGDQRDTQVFREVNDTFSIPLTLGYSPDVARTNEISISVADEFGNVNSYSFTLNASDGAEPTLSFEPTPDETTENRVFVAGSVADDVWIRQANLTLRGTDGNRTGYEPVFSPREYEFGVDRTTNTFNKSLYLVRPGTYEATVNMTDVAGNTTTRTITVERLPREAGDVAPEIAIDHDRTVVLDAETLFLSGSAFEGVTRRLEVETRDPDTGDTLDYRVLHSGENRERVPFDVEVGIANRTEVVVRAVDADGEEHAERFFVDGSARETFVGDGADDGDDEPATVVTVERLVDGRAGTASSSVEVRHARPGSAVAIPPADGTDGSGDESGPNDEANPVAGTRNVSLDSVDLAVSAPTNVTATVTVREAGHGALAAAPGSTAAGTVALRHSLSGANVSEAALVLRVRRAYLADRGFDPANLTVYRLSGGNWSAVPTTRLDARNESVRYRADSPGLSVFSLGTAWSGPNGGDSGEDGTDTWPADPGSTWPPGNGSDWDAVSDPADLPGSPPSDGGGTAGNGTDGDGADGDGNETSDDDDGEANVLVTDARVNRSEVGVNESVAIDATLENRGNATGTYVAGLQIIEGPNVTLAEKRSVSVPAGERETVDFRTRFDSTGNHTVSINGTRAGLVTVSSGGGGGGGGLLSIFAFLPLELIGTVLGALVGLGLVLVLVRFVLRRVGSGGEGASG